MAAPTRPRDWARTDFYATLSVPHDATDDEIARAFRTLAKQMHPDSGATPAQAERFTDVVAAYEVLGHSGNRRDYDAVRAEVVHAAPQPPATAGRAPVRTGAFRTARPARPWTRRHAWLAVIGGVAIALLGVGVAVLVFALRGRAGGSGQVDDPARDITLAIVAAKLLVGGAVFVTLGAFRLTGRSVQATLFGSRPGATAAR